MTRLLVIEDGTEYEEFARLFLADVFEIVAVHSAAEALANIDGIDAMLIDLRFERAHEGQLLGDTSEIAARLFAGDAQRAARWIKEQQGTLILGALREQKHDQPAIFVHDFPARRLLNLRKLYGRVGAVPSFDAAAIVRELEALT